MQRALAIVWLCCAQLALARPLVRAEQPQGVSAEDALGFDEPSVAAPASSTGTTDVAAPGFGSAPSAAADPRSAEGTGAAADSLGFDAAQPDLDVAETVVQAAPAWTLSATLRLQTAMRVEQGGQYRLGKLRQVAGVRAEYKHDFRASGLGADLVASGRGLADFAYLYHTDAYDAPTIETYGAQLLWGETYLRLRSDSFELSFGEQIVNFGHGDVLSALDVVNPRDLREPLLIGLDELRLPVLTSRVSFHFGRARFELLAVHEPFFGLLPPPLGEFSPFRKLLLEDPTLGPALSVRELRNLHVPGHDLRHTDATQYHARLAWGGTRVDLALQAASLLDGLGVPGLPPPAAFSGSDVDLPIFHPRYELVGQSGALSIGAWLLRWEAVFSFHRMLALRRTDTSLLAFEGQRLHTLAGLLGLTYVPSTSSVFALEALQTYVIDNPARSEHATTELLFPLEATQLVFRASLLFFRERLSVTLIALLIGLTQFNAAGVRGEFEYALRDALKVSLGYVTYQPSDDFGLFYGFSRNDRIYCNWRWDFSGP
jgi:hypothetical protein